MAKLFLTQIDESTRGDHTRILDTDTCYHIFEYTSRKRYDFSSTNNLISNLKKKPSTSGTPAYKYKIRAINECAESLKQVLNPNWLKTGTMVPVPCSKVRGHPDYDDRMERICRAVSEEADVRNLIFQSDSTMASHEAGDGDRLTVEDLLAVYRVNEALAAPAPTSIAIVDDVLTVGTHYRAMHTILSQRFPQAQIYGIFIARRVFPDPFEDLEA
ncbi:hypothetical protein [Rhizobium lentis]|uniref:hypothetical protein n=1 Tax=Rhizobium lentis TaxID=1138194 RepID=UPI001C82985B|nr:hypothetical protein [Rhizobium lentis]